MLFDTPSLTINPQVTQIEIRMTAPFHPHRRLTTQTADLNLVLCKRLPTNPLGYCRPMELVSIMPKTSARCHRGNAGGAVS